MVVGAGLLFWRTGAGWAVVLTFVTGGLLALALVLPRVYAPVSRGLDRIQNLTLRAFTWIVLAFVFALIFIPGRLFFRRGHKDRFSRNRRTDTYWTTAKATSASSFDKQY